jgi:hypothetical protein
MDMLQKEIQVQYKGIEKLAFAKTFETDFKKKSTIPTIMVSWSSSTKSSEKKEQEKTLQNWLKVRLDLDTVRVIEY